MVVYFAVVDFCVANTSYSTTKLLLSTFIILLLFCFINPFFLFHLLAWLCPASGGSVNFLAC